MAMTEAKICENVLGHRLGNVKGLCFGPKPALLLNLDTHLLNAR